MSFFGLTMMGPPSPWTIAKYQDVTSIALDDFLAAFRQISDADGRIKMEQVAEIIKISLNGVEAMEEDVAKFTAALEGVEHIDQVAFEKAVIQVQKSSEQLPSKEYSSYRDYRKDWLRHKRAMGDPHQKFQKPMTSSMEVGWGGKEVVKKVDTPAGRIFYHKPSPMSYYGEAMTCFEEGRDFVAGPTLKRMEQEQGL